MEIAKPDSSHVDEPQLDSNVYGRAAASGYFGDGDLVVLPLWKEGKEGKEVR